MKKLLILCALYLLFAFPVVANATSISADWTGTRSTTVGGVTATDGWSGTGNPGFQITWDISLVGLSLFHYEYTISGVGGADLIKDLSHWILEVTDDPDAGEFTNVNPGYDTDSPKGWSPDSSTPNMPSYIYGIKWDVVGDQATYTVSFDTPRDPVWGDFYAKDGIEDVTGVWASAYNVGFGTNPEDIVNPNFMNWIATPNGGDGWPPQSVPEPATMLLLGCGFIGIAVSGKKRFKR